MGIIFLKKRYDFLASSFANLKCRPTFASTNGKMVLETRLSSGKKAEMLVGSVVQLVRMPACHAGGRGFESRPVRRKSSQKCGLFFCWGEKSEQDYWMQRSEQDYWITGLLDCWMDKGRSQNRIIRLLHRLDQLNSHPVHLEIQQSCQRRWGS